MKHLILALLLAAAGCSDSTSSSNSDGGLGDAATSEAGTADGARRDGAPGDGGAGDSTGGDSTTSDARPLLPCPNPLGSAAVSPASGSAKALWLETFAVGATIDYGDATGAAGHFYISARATPSGASATYGGKALGNSATSFLARLDAAGAVQQLTTMSARPALVADAQGVYLVFNWGSGAVTVGTNTATPSGTQLVVARMSHAGAVSWVKAFGVASGSAPRAPRRAVDGKQRLHLASLYSAPVTFGGTKLDCDVAQTIIKSDGTLEAARCLTKTKRSLITLDGFVVDAAGNAYLGGFPGPTYDVGFGPQAIDASGGGTVLFKVAADGKPLWARTSVGAYLRPRAVLRPSGNLLLIGHIPQWGKRPFSLGHDDFPNSCSGAIEHHLTVLDPQGKRLSTAIRGGTLDNVFAGPSDSALLVIQPSRPFLTGYPLTRYTVARVDGSKLSWLQDAEPGATAGNVLPGPRGADEQGRVIVTGNVKGAMKIAKGDSIDHGQTHGDFVMLIAP